MYRFSPIGVIHSCFKEKFGIPRQPGLAPAARAVLELYPPYARREALTGLDAFTHIWVVFVFHAHLNRGWRPTVRPPRLGGNRRLGVFATRSGFRPNPVGLSVVRLAGLRVGPEGAKFDLEGGDFLDGTPVLDIKPYLPYADCVPDADAGFAGQAPPQMPVTFSASAEADCRRIEGQGYAGLKRLIVQVLANDPRPAYYSGYCGPDHSRHHGMCLYDLDVRWVVRQDRIEVVTIARSGAAPGGGTAQ